MANEFETEVKEPETFQAAYNRFLANYLVLGGPGACMEWFEQHVPSLLKLAVRVPEPVPRRVPPPTSKRGVWGLDDFIDYYTSLAS